MGDDIKQIQKKFLEPRLLIVTDPLTDHQPILEASYVNIPIIAFADTDAPLVSALTHTSFRIQSVVVRGSACTDVARTLMLGCLSSAGCCSPLV